MLLHQRVQGFIQLGNFLKQSSVDRLKSLEDVFQSAYYSNPWFTKENIEAALIAISLQLEESSILKWLSSYEKDLAIKKESKKIGVIMAGNIPAVGFHDFLCVLLSGNNFIGKTSSQDKILIPFLAKKLIEFEPGFKDKIEFTEGLLKNLDAIIATGSNNSANYFEYYFGKYPHIIRKNRNSVAVLDGTESKEKLKELGHDIFSYFGLGCRNVSKIFIPKGYDLDAIFSNLLGFAEVINNNKYANNYQYNRTIYLLNSITFFENNFLILKEDSAFSSPISVVYFEFYDAIDQLAAKLREEESLIQCIVSTNKKISNAIPFGTTQSPALWDYADGVDTLKFLTGLH